MRPARRGQRRRALLFLAAALVWTLASCYPNPLVLARSLARYRRFPLDPGIEKRLGWDLPSSPATIEAFVDSLVRSQPDWELYRVPWYMPTPAEAARARRGDCESRAVLLASLLAGRDIPFEIRASFNHIWVDYPGRRPRPGESPDSAYLQGEPGRFRIRWPSRVAWAEFLSVQREQLWDAMPLARKAIWALGLVWIGAASALAGRPRLQAEFASDWRPRPAALVSRTFTLAAVALAAAALAPGLRRGAAPLWLPADLIEASAFSLLVGGFLTWLSLPRSSLAASLEPGGTTVVAVSSLGGRGRERRLGAADVAHVQLQAPRGSLSPWLLSAALRSGERVPLARYRDEHTARSALRRLALGMGRPQVVSADGGDTRIEPEDIGRPLRERLSVGASQPVPRPAGCDLVVEQIGERWTLRYPHPGRSWMYLLGMAAFPALLAIGTTLAVLRWPWLIGLWAGWVLASAMLALTIYTALVLRGEVLARLAEVRTEIGEGELRFHTADRTVETMPLAEIESVELGRLGETPTLVVVSPTRVLHLRDICPVEHRAWARQQLEQAILRLGRHDSARCPHPVTGK